MSVFTRIRQIGEWITGRAITQSELETIDSRWPKIPNFEDGSTHAPTAPVIVGGEGIQLPNAPTVGDDAANKTYVDARETAANSYADAAASTAESNANSHTDDEIDDHVALSIYSSGGTSESNIDNVSGGQVTGTVTMIGDRAFPTIVTVFYHVPYTATGTGLKSVRIAQPGGVYDIPGTFSAVSDVVGSGTATHGLATDIAPVRIRAVVTGTEIELTWTSSASSGTGIVTGSFSYVRPAS